MKIFDNGMHSKELNYFRELLYGKCLRRDTEYDFPCKFMRKSRMERLFEKGRESLKSEIDVVSFLTKIREIYAFQELIKTKSKFEFTSKEKGWV